MSQHAKQQFNHFTKTEMDTGLKLHGLDTDAPSQLADAFRVGADWGAAESRDAKRYTHLRNLHDSDDISAGLWHVRDFYGQVIDKGMLDVEIDKAMKGDK